MIYCSYQHSFINTHCVQMYLFHIQGRRGLLALGSSAFYIGYIVNAVCTRLCTLKWVKHEIQLQIFSSQRMQHHIVITKGVGLKNDKRVE